jgi:sugar lactone lactonase YvrE
MRRIRRMVEDAEREGKPKVRIALHGKGEWPSAWYFRNDDVAYKQIDLGRDVQLLDDTPQNRRKMKQTGRAIWETNVCDLRGWWIWHGTPDALPGKLDWTENVAAFVFNRPNDKRDYFPQDRRPEEYPVGFRTQVLRYVFGRHVWYPIGGERVLVCYKTGERPVEEGAGGYLEGSEKEPRSLAATFSFGVNGSEPGQLDQPRGMTLTPEGNIAVADSKNGRISIFKPDGQFLSSFGEGTLSAEVSGVGDLVCDASGLFYVADTWNHQIRKFSPEGAIIKSASVALDGSNRTNLFGPRGIALDSQGRVYVTDTGFCYVRVYDADLKPLYSWGGKGNAAGSFMEPVGVAIDSKDRVYVADTGNGRIQRFDREGNFDAEFLTLELVETESVSGIEPYLEVLPDDRIVVTYSNDSSFWLIDPDKKTANKFKVYRPSMEKPIGIASDKSGNVWIGDIGAQKIARIELP